MGCSGLFPLGHLMLSAGWEHAASATSLHWTLAMGASYLVGVFLYAMRFPESHFPGVFDYFLHSHQVTARPPAPSHRCQSAHVLTRAACEVGPPHRTSAAQIFHLCVVLAAVIHWIGLLEAYEWHMATPCPLPAASAL